MTHLKAEDTASFALKINRQELNETIDKLRVRLDSLYYIQPNFEIVALLRSCESAFSEYDKRAGVQVVPLKE